MVDLMVDRWESRRAVHWEVKTVNLLETSNWVHNPSVRMGCLKRQCYRELSVQDPNKLSGNRHCK